MTMFAISTQNYRAAQCTVR